MSLLMLATRVVARPLQFLAPTRTLSLALSATRLAPSAPSAAAVTSPRVATIPALGVAHALTALEGRGNRRGSAFLRSATRSNSTTTTPDPDEDGARMGPLDEEPIVTLYNQCDATLPTPDHPSAGSVTIEHVKPISPYLGARQ